jgi:hypothetical protein
MNYQSLIFKTSKGPDLGFFGPENYLTITLVYPQFIQTTN